MRRTRYFDSWKALPRMSWGPRNLYNLWSRSMGPHHNNTTTQNITKFQESSQTLFKQRWQSKKLVRAYHCDYIPEKKFVKWWLPERLPDPMARHSTIGAEASAKAASNAVAEWARPGAASKKQGKRNATEGQDQAQLAPISSLMFAELERRIDVVIFRSCFAHSIHAARQLVVHGKVTLNGLKESDPNTRLNPGDLICVDPSAMTLLIPPKDGKGDLDIFKEKKSKPLPKPVEPVALVEDVAEDLVEENEDEDLEEEVDPSKVGVAPPAENTSLSKKNDPRDPPFRLPPFAAPFLFIPAYLEVSFAACSTVYVRHPTARPYYSEIPSPFDADGEIVRFTWEWYRKHRPKIRGTKQTIRAIMEKGKSGWDGRVD